MRMKKVELVALGFLTPLKFTVTAPGAPVLEAFLIRSAVDTVVSIVHVPPLPRPVGAPLSVAGVADDEKPRAAPVCVQVPLAVSQAWKPTDSTGVAEGSVNVKLYEVEALARELPIATLRGVISEAEAMFGKYANVTIMPITIYKICFVLSFIFIFFTLTIPP